MKKNRILTISILLVSLFAINCIGQKKTSSNELKIRLRTTACNGTCPVFKLEIYANGDVFLYGEAYLDKIGKYKSTIDKSKLEEFVNQFDKINFFELEDSYSSSYMDLPGKYLTYCKDGKTKEVLAYDNIPKELNTLINNIKNLLKELKWEKIE